MLLRFGAPHQAHRLGHLDTVRTVRRCAELFPASDRPQVTAQKGGWDGHPDARGRQADARGGLHQRAPHRAHVALQLIHLQDPGPGAGLAGGHEAAGGAHHAAQHAAVVPLVAPPPSQRCHVCADKEGAKDVEKGAQLGHDITGGEAQQVRGGADADGRLSLSRKVCGVGEAGGFRGGRWSSRGEG